MALLGTDIEQVSRIERAISRTPGFTRRVFTKAGRAYCDRKGRPAQHYAARFCAKEALAKALGLPLSWQEVEVVRDDHGAPAIRLRGRARESLAGRLVCVSLAHAGDYAVASLVVEDQALEFARTLPINCSVLA